MSFKGPLSLCPKAIITSKPKRERWALEEIWDTLFEIDHECEISETRFKGVYLAYLKADVRSIALAFMKNLHAFISTVIPVLLCADINDEANLIKVVKCVGSQAPVEKMLLRLRGTSKRLLNKISIFKVVETPKLGETLVVVEGIDDLVLISVGTFKSCGPGCHLLDPRKEVLLNCLY